MQFPLVAIYVVCLVLQLPLLACASLANSSLSNSSLLHNASLSYSATHALSPPSLSSYSSTSLPIGDYIAAGLGVSTSDTSAETATSSNIAQSALGTDSLITDTTSLDRNGSLAPSTQSPAKVTTTSTNSSQGSLVTSSLITDTTPLYLNGSSAASTQGSAQQSPYSSNTTAPVANATQAAPSNFTGWPNVTDADQCWSEWKSWWAMSELTVTSTSVHTYEWSAGWTSTWASVYQSSPASTVTLQGYTSTELVEILTDFTDIIETTTEIFEQTTETIPGLAAYTETFTEPYANQSTSLSTTILTPTGPPTPPCVLPSSFSSCQAEWEEWATRAVTPPPALPSQTHCFPFPDVPSPTSYPVPEFNTEFYLESTPECYTSYSDATEAYSAFVSNNTRPTCSQAAITGALCTSLMDAYVAGDNVELWDPNVLAQVSLAYGFVDQGDQWSDGYYRMITQTPTVWYWQTDLKFAPSCTQGWGRCAVTGGSVQLLYFPPGLSHPATGPVVVTTLGTTFTSPTYYVSFASVSASDCCNPVGPTITSTIVPFPTGYQPSSIWGYPKDPNNLLFNADPVWTGTASYNITDVLSTPVPYSIYSSQLGCASQAYEAANPWACLTTSPYAPQLVVPEVMLQQLDPAWASCSAYIRGLYDPPKSLTSVGAEASPSLGPATLTSSENSATISATPASGPSDSGPSQTTMPPGPATTASSTISPVKPESTPTEPTPGDPTAANPATIDTFTPDSTVDSSAVSTPNTPGEASNADSPVPNTSADPPPEAASSTDSPTPDTSVDSVGVAAPTPNTPTPSVASPAVATQPAAPATTINALSVLSAADQSFASNQGQTSQDPAASNAAIPSLGPGTSDATTNGANKPGQPAGSVTVVTLGSAAVTVQSPVGSAKGIVVGSATLLPGDTTQIGNVPVSAVSGGIVLGGNSNLGSPASTITFAAPSPQPLSNPTSVAVTIAGSIFTAGVSGGTVQIAGQTLTAGGPAHTVNGQTVSVDNAGILVGTTSVALVGVDSGSQSDPTVDIGGSNFVASSVGNAIVLGTNALAVGGPAQTINGQVISAASNGLLVGPSTFALPSQPTVDVGGSILVASSVGNAIVLGTNTLSVGGPAQTINGQIVSAASNGLLVGTSTFAVPAMAKTENAALTEVYTVSGLRITAVSQNHATVLYEGFSTVTLSGSEGADLAGLTITAASGGLALDGSTVKPAQTAAGEIINGAVFVGTDGDSVTVVRQGSSAILQDGSSTTTVGLGAEAIFDGQTVSLPSAGSDAVVDGSTLPFSIVASDQVVALETGTTVTGSDGKAITIVPDGQSAVLVEDGATTATVTRGALYTIDGVTVSLPQPTASNGVGEVVIDGSSVLLGMLTTGPSGPYSTMMGSVLIDGQTLVPGGSAFVTGGTTYSALPSGSGLEVIAGGTTRTVAPNSNGALSLGSGQSATEVSFATTSDGGLSTRSAAGARPSSTTSDASTTIVSWSVVVSLSTIWCLCIVMI